MNWLKKISNTQIHPFLLAEARKYSSPEEFQQAFLGEIKHGMYWHVTDNPNFLTDPTKGPMDASSLSNSNQMDVGKLMITSHLEYWAEEYSPYRQYAALIDMSDVPVGSYYQVKRGFGNEFFVSDSGSAKVVGVYPIEEALRMDAEYNRKLPNNFDELKNIWEMANSNNKGYS